MTSVSYRDLLLGLSVVFFWAGNATALKFVTLEVEPFTGLLIRLVIGSLVFLPFLRWSSWTQFKHLAQVAFFLVALHWTSLIVAVDYLDASIAAILLSMQALFSCLIGFLFFQEKIGPKTFLGLLIGVSGIVVLVGLPESPPSLIGVGVMAFSMLTFAAANARMKILDTINPLSYAAFMHVFGVLPVGVIAFGFEAPMDVDWGAVNFTPLGIALAYQVLLVSGAHMLWQSLMVRHALSILPNLTLFVPVFGVLIAVLFLGDRVSLDMVLGGGLTMIGVGIIMWRQHAKSAG